MDTVSDARIRWPSSEPRATNCRWLGYRHTYRMIEFDCFETSESLQWQRYLDRSYSHDFYHRSEYHHLSESEGYEARLFVYDDGDEFVAVPLLLRRIPDEKGILTSLWDATSVYGYPGPIASSPDPSTALVAGFQSELSEHLKAKGVISLFSRLNPLLNQASLVDNLGEVTPIGTTLSMDLTLEQDVRRQRYRPNHRRQIDRLIREGATCEMDRDGTFLPLFSSLYAETMVRAGADPHYLFAEDYWEAIFQPEEGCELVVCKLGGRVVSAGLFFLEGNIAQYHLSGTAEGARHYSPLKLLLDYAADWFGHAGANLLHLGGGIGAREDSLFHFKEGFANTRHIYRVWQWILDEARYDELASGHGDSTANHYFPAYRT